MRKMSYTLRLAIEMDGHLSQGRSLKAFIKEYEGGAGCPFTAIFQRYFQKPQPFSAIDHRLKTAQRHLLDLIALGIEGAPIQSSVQDFIAELERQDRLELESFLKKMPYLILIPLFLFQLPALMALLFVPIMSNFFPT